MTCLCVIKLPISIRTISAPDNGHASMRLGRWRWPHPRGSGVNVWPTGKLPRDVSVWPRHSRHWAWQFASMSFLGKLPAVVWWFFFGFRFVVAEVLKHQKWMLCVFFVWWERARRNFRWWCKKNLPNCEKWFTVQKAENKGIFNWWLN